MIQRICLVLEALSIVICLHYLYGEKFKLDIKTTSFLAINMIMMTAINYYHMPKALTMFIYPVIVIYCGVRFGFEIRALVINNILYMVIISGIQLIVLVVCGQAFGKIEIFRDVELLIVNCITFFLILFILPKLKLNIFSRCLQDKEKIYILSLTISIVITVYCLVNYKTINRVELHQVILLFVCLLFICILVFQLAKYKIKTNEAETELKTHKLYEDSFYNLIGNIRLRQHEFDNHINAICNLHYMCDTYEELVSKQEEYCEAVIIENHFNKLLRAGNPLVIGFLYGKFVEADKLGIKVDYAINIKELNIGIPIYKIVEILGNLTNNAVEALKNMDKDKVMYVEMIENNGEFKIEVRNKSKYILQDKMEMFFKKGYSQKGEGRGLGLYNVKTICINNSLNILCENKEIDGENWLSFVIDNKKRNH